MDGDGDVGQVQDVCDRLRQVEDRLERLLASGWRNASAEAADLTSEADGLADLGLSEFAGRLRRVAAATSVREALPAIALALSACRLLRARLAVDAAPPGSWAPLVAAKKRSTAASDRVLPVARVALADDEEVWACTRVSRGFASELLLIEPPQLEATFSDVVQSASGLVTRLFRGRKGTAGSAGDSAERGVTFPWLRRSIQGQLRWRARYPLGASGEVQHCVLEDASWAAVPKDEEDPLAPFRETLASGKLEDGQMVVRGGGQLRVKQLEAAMATSYVWPAPSTEAAFRSVVSDRHWALAWMQGALTTPLALIVPGGRLHKPRLIHLVPGNPEETIGE